MITNDITWSILWSNSVISHFLTRFWTENYVRLSFWPVFGAQDVINGFLRKISLANMLDRYDNEGTFWNALIFVITFVYNDLLSETVIISNCVVSLVAIKQLLIIIDNPADPYCNNYSPQREKHPSSWILWHELWRSETKPLNYIV